MSSFQYYSKTANPLSLLQFHEIIPAESIMIYTLLPPLYNLKMTIFHQTLSKGITPTPSNN
ncbi:hypothetical protein XD05_04725 [Staphylococcus aureus]|nr:hypothetical protein NI36_09765 [Staphylococcus aureus]OHS61105.1 hypothetical protein HMPREF3281_13410 [Staphylococcus sp. HMSC73A05]APD04685.1 hypothetical protein SA40TW_09245 [Staphylococcus aureus]ATN50215.1 hypothetical protein AB478_09245 [Staphylococcus aureus]MDR8520125.1 hypothetical protein [Staphylococcus aureus]